MHRVLFLVFALLLSFGQSVAAGEPLAVKGEKPVVTGQEFRVVINHEEQYSIWMADRELPQGWKATGFVGTQEMALQYIEEVWTDMRPLSSRRETAMRIYKELMHKKK